MFKKILLVILICILLLLTYICILWSMSLNSVVDKEGMVYSAEDNIDKLSLGTYQITEKIENDGISYEDVNITFIENNICSVYQGYGCSFIGTYKIEKDNLICNTVIRRGLEGGLEYSEGNIIFEFVIINEDKIKLSKITNNSKNIYDDTALKAGMIYKLGEDAQIGVFLDNDF